MYRICAITSSLLILLLMVGGCNNGDGISTTDLSMVGDDISTGLTELGENISNDLNEEFRSGSSAGDKDIIIKAAFNTVKIKRSADVSAFEEKIAIRASRNEHEAFQIIPIPALGTYLDGVQVEVSDLYTLDYAFFSKDNFTYFLEGYVYIHTPSDVGGDTGWYPDPLVPMSNPFGVDLNVGVQPVWIDCFVPNGTLPGLYEGDITVTAAGGLMESIPIKLRVLNFTLSDEPKHRTCFGLNREYIAEYHGFPPGDIGPDLMAMRTKYVDFMLDRDISIWGLDWFKPHFMVNPDNTVTFDFSTVEDRVNDYILGGKYRLNTFHFPLRIWDLFDGTLSAGVTTGSSAWRTRVQSYIRELSIYYESRGILDKSFIFIIDEPADYTDYANVRYLGQLIHEVEPRPKFMVTEQAYSWNLDEWGSLLGYVDIFCPVVYLDEPGRHCDPDDPLLTGDYEFEKWVYTGPNVHPWLGLAIDHPAVEPRLLAWLCYQQGITTDFYWSVNYWNTANPWENPFTFISPEYGAGNGALLYPGTCISDYTDQQDIDGPISTIRLEQLREGVEDYEYLWQIGGGTPIPQLELVINGYDEYITEGNYFNHLRNLGLNIWFAD